MTQIKKENNYNFSNDIWSCNSNVAKEVGMEGAIVLHSMFLWIKTYIENNDSQHFKMNEFWTYDSLSSIAKKYSWTKNKAKRIIDKLKKYELIKTENFNKKPFDKTAWYTLTEKGWSFYISQNCQKTTKTRTENGTSRVRKNTSRRTGNGTGKPQKMAKTRTENGTTIPSTNIIKTSTNKDYVSRFFTFGEFIKLTKEEYEKLKKKFGEKETTRMIEILDNYVGSTGRKYKSHYRTILGWVRDKYLKERKWMEKEDMQIF